MRYKILKTIRSIYEEKMKFLAPVLNGVAYSDIYTLDISKHLRVRNWSDGWYWIEMYKGNVEITQASALDVKLIYQDRVAIPSNRVNVSYIDRNIKIKQ